MSMMTRSGELSIDPLQCLLSVLGREDRVRTLQHPFQGVADRFVIINDQDGLHLPPFDRMGSQRVKTVPFPGVALDLDLSVMLVDDPMGNGEAQAHASLLGRKERIEEFFHVLGRDADPGVPERELDPPVILRDLGAQSEPASLRHGLNGIDEEIQDRPVSSVPGPERSKGRD